MPTLTEIRRQARECLSGIWWNAVAIYLIYFALVAFASSIPGVGQIAVILAEGALAYGISLYFISLIRKKQPDLNQLFRGFNFDGPNLGLFGKTLGVFLLSTLYIFLWSLLFIIPGIVAAYSYRMVFYLLVDNPELPVPEILRESKRMMFGNKSRLFLLDLSFIGWFFLSILTFGIGFIWLGPYMWAASTVFYEKLRGKFQKLSQNNNLTKTTRSNPDKVGGIVSDKND